MAIKPDIEAVIEHNHITAGAEISQASGYAATATIMFVPVSTALGSVSLISGGYELATTPTPLGAQQYAADIVTEAVNAFSPKPVQLLNDLINHSTDQVLNQDAEGK